MTHREPFEPNLKALRAILAALIATALATFGVAAFLIMRLPRHGDIRTAPKRTCLASGASCHRFGPNQNGALHASAGRKSH